MKNVIEYIIESQNFLIKGHTKKQHKKYELYKSPYTDIYLKMDSIDDLKELIPDNVYKYYFDQISAYVDDEETEYVLFIRPVEFGNGYAYFPVEKNGVKTFNPMDIEISVKDFTIKFWEKNNWSTM